MSRAAAACIEDRSAGVFSQFIAAPANSTAQRKRRVFAAANRVTVPPKEEPITPIWSASTSGRSLT